MDPMEEFLLPVESDVIQNDQMISGGVLPLESPSRKLGNRLSSEPRLPESPDMKFARKRLGNLLTTIKKHPSDGLGLVTEDFPRQQAEETDRRTTRPPGRPRKTAEQKDGRTNLLEAPTLTCRDSKISFELRGKQYDMIAGRREQEYSLCRAWVHGNVNKEQETTLDTLRTEFAPNLTTEYLACREVHKMPRTDPDIEEVGMFPKIVDKHVRCETDPYDHETMMEAKVEHMRHWKAVKLEWVAHTKSRLARHQKSIDLLEKLFAPPSIKME